MAKIKICLVIMLAFVAIGCSAESPRYRKMLTTRKFQPLRQRPAVQQKRILLARKESVTPYPSADELKPEIPFEEEIRPDEVYGPPDKTYGPPKVDQIPADQLPSEEAPKAFIPSFDAEEFLLTKEEDSLYGIPTQEEQISRLTRRRKTNRNNILSRLVQKRNTRNSQRLILAPSQVIVSPSSILSATLPLSSPYRAQQYYFSNQPFANTAYYQAW